MKRLARYFGSGLLFLVPMSLTVYIVYWLFSTIDNLVRSIADIFDMVIIWRGVGVLITLAVILLVGFLSSLFIMRPVLALVEKMFSRLPLIKLIYTSIKDLIGAFVGDKKKFDQPVLVNLLAGGNVKALGFITRNSLGFLGLEGEVAVYFPQSYNFAGSVLIVPRDQVRAIGADSSDVMAFIVSGGVSGGVGEEKKKCLPD